MRRRASQLGGEANQRPPFSGRRRLVGLVAGLFILLFLAIGVAAGWGRVRTYEWHLNAADALAGFLTLVAVYLLSAVGYVLILEQLSEQPFDRRRLIAVWGRSLLGRYVPGNVLMVASRVVLAQEAGVPRRITFAASTYEQILNVGAAAAGGFVLLVAYGASSTGPVIWLVALVPLGLILLHPRLFGRLSTWALARLGREPLPVLLSVRKLGALFAWYVGTAAVLALGVWLLVRSAGGDGAGSPAYVGLSFLASFVVSMLAFIFPSGLGVREGVFALALARNLPGGVAIAISAGVRLVLTVAEVAFVGLAVLVQRRRPAHPPDGTRAVTRSPK